MDGWMFHPGKHGIIHGARGAKDDSSMHIPSKPKTALLTKKVIFVDPKLNNVKQLKKFACKYLPEQQ